MSLYDNYCGPLKANLEQLLVKITPLLEEKGALVQLNKLSQHLESTIKVITAVNTDSSEPPSCHSPSLQADVDRMANDVLCSILVRNHKSHSYKPLLAPQNFLKTIKHSKLSPFIDITTVLSGLRSHFKESTETLLHDLDGLSCPKTIDHSIDSLLVMIVYFHINLHAGSLFFSEEGINSKEYFQYCDGMLYVLDKVQKAFYCNPFSIDGIMGSKPDIKNRDNINNLIDFIKQPIKLFLDNRAGLFKTIREKIESPIDLTADQLFHNLLHALYYTHPPSLKGWVDLLSSIKFHDLSDEKKCRLLFFTEQ